MTPERKLQLIDQEVAACKRVLTSHGRQRHTRGLITDEQIRRFVQSCLDLHYPMIQEWGGWRWHHDTCLNSKPSPDDVLKAWTEAGGCLAPLEMTLHRAYPVFMNRIVMDISASEWEGHALRGLDGTLEAVPFRVRNKTTAYVSLEHMGSDEKSIASCLSMFGEILSRWDSDADLGPPHLKLKPGSRVVPQMVGQLKKAGYSTGLLKMVQKFGANLGQLWSAQRGDEWGISLSCAPSSFLRLGHVGEYNSCYRFGHEYEHSKLALALTQGSYVAFVYKPPAAINEDSSLPRTGTVAGRWFGFYRTIEQVSSPDGAPPVTIRDPFITQTNIYLLERHIARQLLRKAFVSLGHEDHAKEMVTYTEDLRGPIEDGVLYLNGDGIMLARSRPDVAGAFAMDDVLYDELGTERLSCRSCGNRLNNSDEYGCADCGHSYCGECAIWCESCSEYYCESCTVFSTCGQPDCYSYVCESHTHSCECGQIICDRCFDVGDVARCNCCDGLMCSSCKGDSAPCVECEETACNSCVQECAHCSKLVCDDCEGDTHDENCPDKPDDSEDM